MFGCSYESNTPEYFAKLAQVVRRAKQVDLLVVLAARESGAALPSQEFWTRCAAYFKDYPNILFDVFSEPSPSLPANTGDPHSAAANRYQFIARRLAESAEPQQVGTRSGNMAAA